VFPVAAVAAVGWLLLFVVLLAVPPPSRPRLDGNPPEQALPGDEPPAVVSLLAGQFDRCGFGVTLMDLAARGWFRFSGPAGPTGPAGPAGAWGPAGPVMCVVSAETPPGPLEPFERRVVAHAAMPGWPATPPPSVWYRPCWAVEPAPGAHPLADIAWLANPAEGRPRPD
jgi:hypothetical protein